MPAKSPPIYVRTLHGVRMFNERELLPDLFIGFDEQNGIHVYTPTEYRGYVIHWPKPTGNRWRLHVWGPKGAGSMRRTHFVTWAGAAAALERMAERLHTDPPQRRGTTTVPNASFATEKTIK